MRPVIFGCAGECLTEAEAALFARIRPAGLILFARNCKSYSQIRELTESFANAVERERPLILIDQEGGRVSRLPPPLCPVSPPASRFGALFADHPARGRHALSAYCRMLAGVLLPMGISVNCFPLLDVRHADADDIMGDRTFSDDPDMVAALGRIAVDAMLGAGLLPVVKHIPGHGRAHVDSHKERPVVTAERDELEAVDFKPFRALADAPLAMTAHITYSAWDAEFCASHSQIVIADVIRQKIGFGGLLISDDIGMGALAGPVDERAKKAWSAGCDIVLHCSGALDEMVTIGEIAPDCHADQKEKLNIISSLASDSTAIDVAREARTLKQILNTGA